jgi:hypothetical protein
MQTGTESTSPTGPPQTGTESNPTTAPTQTGTESTSATALTQTGNGSGCGVVPSDFYATALPGEVCVAATFTSYYGACTYEALPTGPWYRI